MMFCHSDKGFSTLSWKLTVKTDECADVLWTYLQHTFVSLAFQLSFGMALDNTSLMHDSKLIAHSDSPEHSQT